MLMLMLMFMLIVDFCRRGGAAGGRWRQHDPAVPGGRTPSRVLSGVVLQVGIIRYSSPPEKFRKFALWGQKHLNGNFSLVIFLTLSLRK